MTRRKQRDGVEWPSIYCLGGMIKTQAESCLGGYKHFPSISAWITLSSQTDKSSLIHLKVSDLVSLVKIKEFDCQ